MNYVKGILSGFAAIAIGQFACFCMFFPTPPPRPVDSTGGGTTATDLSGFLKIYLHSPAFWVISAFLFWVFFMASRSNTFVRVCFFWIPTVTVSALTVTVAGLYTYFWMRFFR